MALLKRRSPATIAQVISIATGGRGISVSFRGDDAYTDGKEIVLPAMLTPEAEELAIGYAWHESAHILETEFGVTDEYRAETEKRPIIHRVYNSLEDGRIEVAIRHQFPGVHPRLNELLARFRDQGAKGEGVINLFFRPDNVKSPPNALLGFVLNWTRAEVNGYDAIHYLNEWRDCLASLVGEDVVRQVEQILETTRALSSTAEAKRAAIKIVDAVKIPEQPQGKPKPKPDEGEKSDETEDSDGSGANQDDDGSQESGDEAGDGGDQKSDSEKSDDTGSGQGGKGKDDQKEGAQQGSGQNETGDQPGENQKAAGDKKGPSKAAQKKAIQDIQNAKESDLETTDLGDIASKAINKSQSEAKGGQAGGAGSSTGLTLRSGGADPKLYHSIAATASTLGGRLRGIIQAETLVSNRSAKRSGKRLDRRKLVRVALDDPRIWQRRLEEINTSGHVHLLLDTSGSMRPLIDVLKVAGLATTRAIEAVDELSVSASTLPIGGASWLLKATHERTQSISRRFGELRHDGGTPLHTAMDDAMPLILNQDVANRLLIIFTDGQPDCVQSVKSRTAELAKAGVSTGCVILGDGRNQLEDFLPSRRLDHLAALPVVVTNLCADLMRSRLRSAA